MAPVAVEGKIRDAFEDWLANRAYVDGNGNYHVKGKHVSGPIAPWNKEVKRAFTSVTHFHIAAHTWAAAHRSHTSCSLNTSL